MNEQHSARPTDPNGDQVQWDDYEEDGPMDLEDQLESALDRAFDNEQSERQGDLIALFRAEY